MVFSPSVRCGRCAAEHVALSWFVFSFFATHYAPLPTVTPGLCFSMRIGCGYVVTAIAKLIYRPAGILTATAEVLMAQQDCIV
jgi:hypothetical protein